MSLCTVCEGGRDGVLQGEESMAFASRTLIVA